MQFLTDTIDGCCPLKTFRRESWGGKKCNDVTELFICFAGAKIVGVNCHFDPETCVKTVKLMKEGVEKAGLKATSLFNPNTDDEPEQKNLLHLFPDSSGAKDPDQMGNAEICPWSIQRWYSLYRWLLWIRALSHPCCGWGAGAWAGLHACSIPKAWRMG